MTMSNTKYATNSLTGSISMVVKNNSMTVTSFVNRTAKVKIENVMKFTVLTEYTELTTTGVGWSDVKHLAANYLLE